MVIQEFGLDLDELHNLLNGWLDVCEPGNEDLEGKRQSLQASVERVEAASQSCQATLAALNEGVAGLAAAAAGQSATYSELQQGVVSTLKAAGEARAQSTEAARSELQSARAAVDGVRQGVDSHDAQLAVGHAQFGSLSERARETLRSLGVSSLASHQALASAADRAGQALQARGQSCTANLGKHGGHLQQLGSQTIPADLSRVGAWLQNDVLSRHTGAVALTANAALESYKEFTQAVNQLVQQGATEVTSALTTAGQSCGQVRQNLTRHVKERSSPNIQAMGREQKLLQGTFEQGAKKAAECAQQFGELRHKYEIIKRNV